MGMKGKRIKPNWNIAPWGNNFLLQNRRRYFNSTPLFKRCLVEIIGWNPNSMVLPFSEMISGNRSIFNWVQAFLPILADRFAQMLSSSLVGVGDQSECQLFVVSWRRDTTVIALLGTSIPRVTGSLARRQRVVTATVRPVLGGFPAKYTSECGALMLSRWKRSCLHHRICKIWMQRLEALPESILPVSLTSSRAKCRNFEKLSFVEFEFSKLRNSVE